MYFNVFLYGAHSLKIFAMKQIAFVWMNVIECYRFRLHALRRDAIDGEMSDWLVWLGRIKCKYIVDN